MFNHAPFCSVRDFLHFALGHRELFPVCFTSENYFFLLEWDVLEFGVGDLLATFQYYF